MIPPVVLRALDRLRPVLLVVAIAALAFGCAQKQVSTGIYQLRQGDFSDAVASFRDAVARDPDAAIAHYNLGFALGADVRARAAGGDFDGTVEDLREAYRHFDRAVALDPDTYAGTVATARRFDFGELYNLAVDFSGSGALDDATETLVLAREAAADALSAQRANVLRLQIDMSRALAAGGPDARERYMGVLAELDRIRREGPVDDALVDEIENTLARARALIGADDGVR